MEIMKSHWDDQVSNGSGDATITVEPLQGRMAFHKLFIRSTAWGTDGTEGIDFVTINVDGVRYGEVYEDAEIYVPGPISSIEIEETHINTATTSVSLELWSSENAISSDGWQTLLTIIPLVNNTNDTLDAPQGCLDERSEHRWVAVSTDWAGGAGSATLVSLTALGTATTVATLNANGEAVSSAGIDKVRMTTANMGAGARTKLFVTHIVPIR